MLATVCSWSGAERNERSVAEEFRLNLPFLHDKYYMLAARSAETSQDQMLAGLGPHSYPPRSDAMFPSY